MNREKYTFKYEYFYKNKVVYNKKQVCINILIMYLVYKFSM